MVAETFIVSIGKPLSGKKYLCKMKRRPADNPTARKKLQLMACSEELDTTHLTEQCDSSVYSSGPECMNIIPKEEIIYMNADNFNYEVELSNDECESESVIRENSDTNGDMYLIPNEETIYMNADNFTCKVELNNDQNESFVSEDEITEISYTTDTVNLNSKKEVNYEIQEPFQYQEGLNNLKNEVVLSECAVNEECGNDHENEADDAKTCFDDTFTYLDRMISANLENEDDELDFDFCFENVEKEIIVNNDEKQEAKGDGGSESENEEEEEQAVSGFLAAEFKPLPSLFKINTENYLTSNTHLSENDIFDGFGETFLNDDDDLSSNEEYDGDREDKNIKDLICAVKEESTVIKYETENELKNEEDSDIFDCKLEVAENLEYSSDVPSEKPSEFKAEQCTRTGSDDHHYQEKIQSAVNEKPRKIIRFMSLSEEQVLLKRLRNIIQKKTDVPSYIHRYYRKLVLRDKKRVRNLPVFDLDHYMRKKGRKKEEEHSLERSIIYRQMQYDEVRTLDRYQVVKTIDASSLQENEAFMMKLVGMQKLEPFYSPYKKRMVKPYIRQDWDTKPFWLKFLQEVDEKMNKNKISWQPIQMYPINYCYIQQVHISAVNVLCHEYFYPGIDVSDCLNYPEFTCIALYKKLVIGFAVMVPDVTNTEAYISFLFTKPEWRNAGIASFMLYHLIQASQEKDVTLHVAVKNPAMILYQKFGFKIEKFEYNFYDRYFPAYSIECRHAFFLRLEK